ncbi:hypothetical protein DYI95_009760 [Thermaerobacter sp. PB12/4term]|uniref:hypothetical protein n=1 Tax=Thermaerobacter sp. PB12/4term TaxID=2293838 RepID=UPI000E329234|nr:hypothetical protein [Thermaerobacter sp. PB12/4term]QIA27756.1 hypothetical protein DYI95_009760 [Thermaerobacter sp. PB12/4term]
MDRDDRPDDAGPSHDHLHAEEGESPQPTGPGESPEEGRRLPRQGYSRPRRDHPYDAKVLSDLAQVFMETTLREDGTVICPDRREALALAEQVLDILYYSGFYNAADVAGLRFHLYPRLDADGQPDLIYANTWMDGRWMEIAVIEVPRPNARPPEDGAPAPPGRVTVRPGLSEPGRNGRVPTGLGGLRQPD